MRDAALASLLLVAAVGTPLYAAEPTPGGIAIGPITAVMPAAVAIRH